jgi:MoaA/NifB/PqqE/SkfB family radical SAM enzyme
MNWQQKILRHRHRTARGWDLVSRHGGSFLRHATPTKILNLVRVQTEMAGRQAEVQSLPYEIILDLTNRCNLRCPLCVTGQRLNDRPGGKMRLEDFRRVVDELAPYLFKVRLHSWGEPFLHDRLYDMIAYLGSRNIGTEVSSNFNAFRRDEAGALVDSGLELLVISLDGVTEEVYRRYRVGGDLSMVIENVKALVQEKRRRGSLLPLIEIQFLLMKHNFHQRQDIRKLAADLGADRCRVYPLAINAQDERQRRAWLPDDLRYSRYFPDTFEDRIYSTQRVCPWLWRSAVVNWDGTVSPCCVYEGRKTDMGSNVFSAGFMAVWKGEAYRMARAVFRRRSEGAGVSEARTICHFCRGLPKAPDPEQQGIY